jgi:hypothetical protein
MSDLCFITTCRGRLANLKQSLPTFAAQSGTSCVVVDYDCPEGTADWVEASFPRVKVVRATNRPRFELSRARNLGAEAADAPWLCFIDADICLAPHFSSVVLPLLEPGNYYRTTEPRPTDLWGQCICHRDHFQRIEGYDEVLQGWGGDDGDFYRRLEMAGARYRTFPSELLYFLPHSNASRVEHYDLKDQWLNATANRIYCHIKWDLMKLKQRNLPLETRAGMYEKLRHQILAAHADGEPLEMSIPVYREDTWCCGPLDARIVYRLPQPRGDSKEPTDEPSNG